MVINQGYSAVVIRDAWLAVVCLGFVGVFLTQYFMRERHLEDVVDQSHTLLRALALCFCLVMILISNGNSDAFIYFQF